ncbi:MAG: hypothetical protein MMC23_002612 [Stictis urceolatum]|nr:hypothetical protein [Stictis urceolata]
MTPGGHQSTSVRENFGPILAPVDPTPNNDLDAQAPEQQDLESISDNNFYERPHSNTNLNSASQAKRGTRSTRSSASSTAYSPSRRSRRSSARGSNRHVWLLAHSEGSDFSVPSVPGSGSMRELPQAHLRHNPAPRRRALPEVSNEYPSSPTPRLARTSSGRIVPHPPQRLKHLKDRKIPLGPPVWSPDDLHHGKADTRPSRQPIGKRKPWPLVGNFQPSFPDGPEPVDPEHETESLHLQNSPAAEPGLTAEEATRGTGQLKPRLQSESPTRATHDEGTNQTSDHQEPSDNGTNSEEQGLQSTNIEPRGDGPDFMRTYPPIEDPVDPACRLSKCSLILQRSMFLAVIIILNGAALAAALLSPRHFWILVFMVFIKSRDSKL